MNGIYLCIQIAAYLALEAFAKQCAPRDDGVLPATLGSLRSSDHYPLEVELKGYVNLVPTQ